MTVCKVQECKITTKFNTFFCVCNSAFFFFNETVHRDGFFNHIENAYSSNHLWDSYWTEQDLKKSKCSNWKLSACTFQGGHKLELYIKHACPWSGQC